MTSPAVSVHVRDPLYEVGRKQQELGMRPLPVVDDGGHLRGVVEASDFAKVFFQGLDPHLADEVPIDMENLIRALDAEVVVAAPDRHVRNKVMVAAWSADSIRERLEKDLILVLGDRADVQRAAIELGVGMLVITGGSPVEPDVVELAEKRGVRILTVEHHTAATLRLMQMSVPVSLIMRVDPPAAEPDELVDDVRDLLMAERAVAVVDDGRHVFGVITRADVLRGARRRVVLVDHNERGQAVSGVEQAEIVGVVDHHRVADLQTSAPPLMRVEPVGACSTLVAKLFAEAGVEPSQPIAGVLLGAILTDTLLFKSPTTTPDDRRVAERLAELAGVAADDLGAELIAIASDLSHRSAEELVRGDFKEFSLDDVKFGVAMIETGDARSVLGRRAEIQKAMRKVRDREYASVLVAVTDVVHDRTTILVEGHAAAAARAFNAASDEGDAIELPGVYSRKKQIVPMLGRIKELIEARR
jgi:manganese-dependent inorganic pyrophosphatase